MTREKNSALLLKIGSIFLTCSVVFSPILMLYSIKISTITFFDALSFASLLLIVIALLLNKSVLTLFSRIFSPLLPYLVCVLFSFLPSCILVGFKLDILFRTLRYAYFILIVVLFVKFFDTKIGIGVYKWVCIISTIFVFVQFISLKLFNKAISGYVNFIPMIDEDLKRIAEDATLIRTQRPKAFFQEPAHYAAFISLFIFLDFLYLERKKISFVIDLFLFAGVVLSSATTGIVMCLICFVAFWIKIIISGEKKRIIVASSFALLLISVGVVMLCFGLLNSVVSKITNVQSFLARFDGYRYVFDFSSFESAFVTLFIGRGMLDLGTFYLSGYPRILYYFGIIGLLGFSYSLISTNKKALPFASFFMIMNLGTVSALSPFMILFFSFFISLAKPRKLKDLLDLNKNYVQIGI